MEIFEVEPMIIVTTICFGLYVAFLLVLLSGLSRKTNSQREGIPERPITVIVPVRNERENIPNLLQDLDRQRYAQFDIVVVDDHSEDDTNLRIQESASARVRVVPNHGAGKKSAITTGISLATGEIIVTTDGDCRVDANWLTSVNNCFASPQTDMAIGTVIIGEADTLFSKMQQLEFASLVGTSVSSLQLRLPTMCNGANLAYRKNAFTNTGGYQDNLHIPSGDDEFLLRKIFARNPNSVVYNPGPAVITKAQPSLSAFLQQRLRWAGKWKFNSSWSTRLLAVFILITQFVSICCFYRIACGNLTFLIPIFLRILIEYIVLKKFTRFLGMRFHGASFLLLQLCYPFYVTFVGIASLVKPYSWKGRIYD